jgi:hypothetical protein
MLGHGSEFCRWRHFDKNRRRREHAQLKRILERGGTPPDLPVEPTRLFGNELVLVHGFSVDQARQVLQ